MLFPFKYIILYNIPKLTGDMMNIMECIIPISIILIFFSTNIYHSSYREFRFFFKSNHLSCSYLLL